MSTFNDIYIYIYTHTIKIFPDSVVEIGKKTFYEKYDKTKHKYLVINYDKFGLLESPNLILELTKQRIDFVVLDEIHFTKKREKKKESHRHKNIEGLMTAVKKKNKDVYVLSMSATPVINELQEGISLLELTTGIKYDDLKNRAIPQNAVKLHEKISLNSIRWKYKMHAEPEEIEVEADITGNNISVAELKRNPLLLEQLGLPAKIPEIIKHIDGKTIIYTLYVDEIIPTIIKAVEQAGYDCVEFSGRDNTGLRRFKEDPKLQVLVASRPISTGVDGLQDVCHNLIISCLPWTDADFEQTIGRIDRQKQKNPVSVYVIKAKLVADGRGEYRYDQRKWGMLTWKHKLANCAVDGELPEKNMLSIKQIQMETIEWLARIERGEVSTFQRRDLDTRLKPVEISTLPSNERQNLYRNLGEFNKMNKVFNTSNSNTIHEKIKQDPQYLVQYHEKLDETRKLWTVDPVKVIANKINNLPIPDRIIAKMVIGDFGCGRAMLAELLNNKVYNFDHHNILGENVIACDMKRTPLEKERLDVTVFSLSLMGQNWTEYIAEAKRCLRKKGTLMIAETTKSLSARLSTLKDEITKQGFKINSENQEGDFTFIEAMKL